MFKHFSSKIKIRKLCNKTCEKNQHVTWCIGLKLRFINVEYWIWNFLLVTGIGWYFLFSNVSSLTKYCFSCLVLCLSSFAASNLKEHKNKIKLHICLSISCTNYIFQEFIIICGKLYFNVFISFQCIVIPFLNVFHNCHLCITDLFVYCLFYAGK